MVFVLGVVEAVHDVDEWDGDAFFVDLEDELVGVMAVHDFLVDEVLVL